MQIIAGGWGAGGRGGTAICGNGITQAITSYLFNLADSTRSTLVPKTEPVAGTGLHRASYEIAVRSAVAGRESALNYKGVLSKFHQPPGWICWHF